jgi:thiol-disulfide isomerase/thioredoxin
MTQQTKDPGPKSAARARLNWWVVVAVAALALGLATLVIGPPQFASSPYAPYAKGAMAKLSFKFAGQKPPAVAFGGPDGQPTSLAAFRGRAVLMNLWATWCGPCVGELPALDALQKDLGGDTFQVVAVNMDADDAGAAARFLAEHGLTNLALYTDPKLQMDPALAGPGIPASVLYDAEGREVGRLFGAVDWASPEARALISRVIHPPKEK